MIIDFHTHIFPDALAERARQTLVKNTEKFGNNYEPIHDMTKAGLVRAMDEFGIDKSVIQPIATKPSQNKSMNEWAAGTADDRVIGFGSLHPDTDDYRRDIDRIVELGLKGLKFHAEYQLFYPDEPRMLRIYDYAFSKGLIVLHHAGYDPGTPPPFHTSPARFAEVLRQMQGGVMVLAHLGGHAQWDDVEKYLVGKDVYFDTSMGTSFYGAERLTRIIQNHGADRVLFASDSPWSNGKDEIAAIRALPLTPEEIEKVLGGNAERLLKA